MSTITLQSDVPLSVTKFRGLSDLRKKILDDEVFEVVLEEVPESEITPQLRKKMEKAQKLPESAWHNI